MVTLATKNRRGILQTWSLRARTQKTLVFNSETYRLAIPPADMRDSAEKKISFQMNPKAPENKENPNIKSIWLSPLINN